MAVTLSKEVLRALQDAFPLHQILQPEYATIATDHSLLQSSLAISNRELTRVAPGFRCRQLLGQWPAVVHEAGLVFHFLAEPGKLGRTWRIPRFPIVRKSRKLFSLSIFDNARARHVSVESAVRPDNDSGSGR